ncbi:MAG: glycoside hydrolase family 3 protein [Clostridia bacterium]|nr:glycoside hydrolase family 3 protein [Clostridia bacterium]
MFNKKIVILLLVVMAFIAVGCCSLAFLMNKESGNIEESKNTQIEENLFEQKNEVNQANIKNIIQEEIANEVAFNEAIDSEKLSEIVSMNDMFGKYYEKSKDVLNMMSIEEKIGQMLLARYPEKNADEEIIELNPGGYVLFGRDFKNETKDSITEKINENQSKSKVKMFIGVDEEGGEVVRVSSYSQYRDKKFKAQKEIFDEKAIEGVVEDSHEKTNLLKNLGINMNLAPVVDVSTDENSFIYNRTIGKGAEETAEYAKAIVKAMNEDKILSTLKHFPRIWK